jgi:hypothetical protein
MQPNRGMVIQQLLACVLIRASPRAVPVASYPLLYTEHVFLGGNWPPMQHALACLG